MAMTAWSANVSSRAISRRMNGRTRSRVTVSTPTASPARRSGTPWCRLASGVDVVRELREDRRIRSAGTWIVRRSSSETTGFRRSESRAISPTSDFENSRLTTLRSTSTSRSSKTAPAPSMSRVTLRAIASKTCCKSVGEEAITRSTSAVAVCCSSASCRSSVALFQLLEQARVLDGDHGLVGEGLYQRNLSVRERSGFCSPDSDCADCLPSAHQGHDQADRCPASRDGRGAGNSVSTTVA